jgi:hypothetical protein
MLSPTQLQDAIYTATARPGSFETKGYNAGMSMELLDPAHATREVAEMMRAFGQVSRDEMPKKAHTSSLQAMLMMNSKVVLERVKAEGGSRVEQLLSSDENDRDIVMKLYLATLSREPLQGELEVAMRELDRDRRKGLENLQWALLNTPEFLFNY